MTQLEKQAETIKRLQAKIHKMDRELNIVHQALTECYNVDQCTHIVKEALNKIDKLTPQTNK